MNHGLQVRIQLALILRHFGLPKDLRQVIIRKVWFSCQSQVLRLERMSVLQFRPKFEIPILMVVVKTVDRNRGSIGRTYSNFYWTDILSPVEDIITHNFNDETYYQSLKRKKLKK